MSITNQSPTDFANDPDNAEAIYRLNTNGNAEEYTSTAGTYSTLEVWRLQGASSDYEVRATVNSGAVSSGTTGSWLSLSSSQSWGRTRLAIGVSTVDLTIEIRRASDGVVLDSANVVLEAEVSA